MLFAEQVVDGFDRVEGGDGDLDEEGDPVGHGSIPQAGEFLRLEGLGAFALLADETGHGVDELSQVEVSSAVVAGAAHQVDGVEVGRRLEDVLLLRVVVVDLCRFDYLKASTTHGINCVEGTASRFAEVFHHSADTHRAVEERVQVMGGISVWYHDVQFLFCEACYLAECFLVGMAVEGAQVRECLVLEVEEESSEDLFVDDGGVLHPVGHDVIDILDED